VALAQSFSTPEIDESENSARASSRVSHQKPTRRSP
jgi:hypothetical protein